MKYTAEMASGGLSRKAQLHELHEITYLQYIKAQKY
jgi:hypothetical protein